MTREEWNRATDRFVEICNEKIGKPIQTGILIPQSAPQAHRLITEEAIKGFAWNMGNNNPLFVNPDYAKNTCWGGVIAPPGRFLGYIAETGSFSREGVVEGHSHLYGGTTYEYYDVVRPGEAYHIFDEFLGCKEKQLPPEKVGKYRLLSMQARRSYINQEDKTVAVATSTVMVTCVYPEDKKKRGDSVVFGEVKKPVYSDEELNQLYQYYEDYCRGKYTRGAEKRYWEDVNEGDPLPVLIKGPLDVMDVMAFQCAVGGMLGGAATKWEAMRAEPGFRDPDTRAWMHRAAFHFSDQYAQSAGFPLALAYGAMAEAYVSDLVTDWMGDDGFVKRMSHQQRKPMFQGDMIRITGTVAKKYVENREHLVELSISANNQKEDKVCPSVAIVRLPTRET